MLFGAECHWHAQSQFALSPGGETPSPSRQPFTDGESLSIIFHSRPLSQAQFTMNRHFSKPSPSSPAHPGLLVPCLPHSIKKPLLQCSRGLQEGLQQTSSTCCSGSQARFTYHLFSISYQYLQIHILIPLLSQSCSCFLCPCRTAFRKNCSTLPVSHLHYSCCKPSCSHCISLPL